MTRKSRYEGSESSLSSILTNRSSRGAGDDRWEWNDRDTTGSYSERIERLASASNSAKDGLFEVLTGLQFIHYIIIQKASAASWVRPSNRVSVAKERGEPIMKGMIVEDLHFLFSFILSLPFVDRK